MGLHLFKKTSKKPGDAPGTIVHVGDATNEQIDLELITYDATTFSEEKISTNDITKIEEKLGVKWLNITGIHETELIQKIGTQFDIHKLVLEDIANSARYAKIEDYSESIYTVLKMFYVDSNNEIRMEHINLILKKNLVISFQELREMFLNLLEKEYEIEERKCMKVIQIICFMH